MRVFRPLAYSATLYMVVCLASLTSVADAERMNGWESPRTEIYRANLLTLDEERAVGQRLAYLYEQRHTLLTGTETQIRLDRIKARLGPVIGGQALEIKIILGKRPEAVSFPPGRIYITSALMQLAQSDDELAAVIAHEAAHVACHHLARLIALAQTLPAAERESFPTRTAIITGQSAQFIFPAALDVARRYSEIEADQFAVGWLARSGYRQESLAMLLANLATRLSPCAPEERAALQERINLINKQSLASMR